MDTSKAVLIRETPEAYWFRYYFRGRWIVMSIPKD